jgi:hypothetical protein
MSQPEDLPTLQSAEAPAGGRTVYAALALGALAVLVLPLLLRGFEEWSLLPALVGALALAVRWRAGPVLVLLVLLWLVLADAWGMSPLTLAETLVRWAQSLIVVGLGLEEGPDLPAMRPQSVDLLPDLFLCAAVLVYVAAHCRLMSLVGNVFPVDARPRPGPAKARRGRPTAAAVPPAPARRSERLASADEVTALLVAGPALALAVWLGWWVLSGWTPHQSWATLTDLVRELREATVPAGGHRIDWSWLQGQGEVWLELPTPVWYAVVLVWLFAVVLLLGNAVIGYAAARRMTPEEAELFLQDALWRETRREQSRLARWLAWARRKK